MADKPKWVKLLLEMEKHCHAAVHEIEFKDSLLDPDGK